MTTLVGNEILLVSGVVGTASVRPAAIAFPITTQDIANLATGGGGNGPFLPVAGGTVTGAAEFDDSVSITTGPVFIGGAQQATNLVTIRGTTYQISTNTQPTGDVYHNAMVNTVSYSADGTSGDTVGLAAQMFVRANGHTVGNSASQHTTAVYGVGQLTTTGTIAWINGVIAASGNSGAGIVTAAVDFRGHTDFNTGGGSIGEHWMIYQETSTAATNERGAYFSAPVAIGDSSPTSAWLFKVLPNSPNLTSGSWMSVGTGTGALLVTSTGASIFPGFNPGAGGFGAIDIMSGTGNAGAAGDTTGFLYMPGLAADPTGVPSNAAAGRIAFRFQTTSKKIFAYTGGAWVSSAALA